MQSSWTGRTDGTTPEHLRWHQVVEPYGAGVEPGACVFVGFASDEGVRRNKGRVGAAAGPDALRRALSPMALASPHRAYDAGTVTVSDARLEEGQRALGAEVSTLLDAGHFPIVLGGGHEIAYGTYLGVAGSARGRAAGRIGILNLDAHFDLRADPVPSSGTPFRQILEADPGVRYAVLGISQPSNTAALFDTAAKYDVRYLLDDDCDPESALGFVEDFLAEIDLLYLTIDLDVLPASVAPGVSAPAAFGIPLATIQAVCDRVTASGKLAVVDVAELNPGLDIDNRTARTAARLIHRIVTKHVPYSANPS
ncbi:formimidoylglutamase [Nocardia cyriacigeorgica]|uniref:Formimidoylglutamase n=1 Tax=Nocardia cyriacigeorgica TaxID=135487 RepID=A0A4U8W482_9NOCA|nr:formimidoylglutamase [Nocardia cyriacigeorgica]MBF6100946.1 formimidoylglutamase [Nocardia cyriacigeorgica]MBF6160404.1 formimidoylglutamase [Nocardia cyriacigeorgica]MBF6199489.1 formimidoylglutamase [Nocardia cyriacigeorgica]MBF6515779.1 formimidoylglutamase [Nocardia cyriacigeorgica]VFB00723.1 Formimidoylglutamase [Nocardia cyriacigeorgica]